MLLLCSHHYSSNMYYASFNITPDSAEELNENYDDMSCMTRYTGTVGTSFRHAVDESKSDSMKIVHLRPRDISKTIWMQYVINRVSEKILNIAI